MGAAIGAILSAIASAAMSSALSPGQQKTQPQASSLGTTSSQSVLGDDSLQAAIMQNFMNGAQARKAAF